MDPSRFLRIPILAAVGTLDVDRDATFRTSAKVNERQGGDRIERARRWVEAMQTAARTRSIRARHDLALLEGAGHSFADCVEAGLARLTFEFFDSVDAEAPLASEPAPNIK
jgi:hypothetical protein